MSGATKPVKLTVSKAHLSFLDTIVTPKGKNSPTAALWQILEAEKQKAANSVN